MIMTSPDDALVEVDPSQVPPEWYRYCINTQGGHNKWYLVTIHLQDDGSFLCRRTWGPRPFEPGKGQWSEAKALSWDAAQRIANNWFNSKINTSGYAETAWGA